MDETLPTAQEFVKNGKAKFIGISGYPLSVLLEIVEKSTVKIDCVLTYCRDTLIDNTLQDFLPKFQVIFFLNFILSKLFLASPNISQITGKKCRCYKCRLYRNAITNKLWSTIMASSLTAFERFM